MYPETDLTARLAALPPEWPASLLPEIRERLRADGRKVVVLDDDPTGTQTVYDVPVLTTWGVSELQAELHGPAPAFYILTNSRSLDLPAAQALNREIGANLKTAAARAGARFEVVSRSDSTLRGHFPGETDALAAALGLQDAPVLLVPFFLEGGRYTLDDVHYVLQDGRLVPAAETAFARDAAFGYTQSDLKAWVSEKTAGRIPAAQVRSLSLDTLRAGGPDAAAGVLAALPPGSVCAVNAAAYRDLEVFVLALLLAEGQGARFLLRTAASFVRVRLGLDARPPLRAAELSGPRPAQAGGLFVTGSYVPLTTAQVRSLLARTPVVELEMQVAHLLEEPARTAEIERVAAAMNRALREGQDVVVYTSRALLRGDSAHASLEIGRRVSDGLIAVVRRLEVTPRFLVAKGGITSSDVATRGLGVRRARVAGQILPGVPVWELGPESRFPGLPYIVFPGNVGSHDALVQVWQTFQSGDIPIPTPDGGPHDA